MQRVSELESEPVVGRFYLVPCVPLYVSGVRGGWWPVVTPPHRDPELSAHFEHLHYDWRFVSKAHYEHVVQDGGSEASVYRTVANVHSSSHGAVEERRVLCKRVPAPFPSHDPDGTQNRLVRILEPMYRDRKLGACLTCPHKGASLKNQPVRDGKVICPMHGLQFDVNTGELVPRIS